MSEMTESGVGGTGGKENMGLTEERLIELINNDIDALNSAPEHDELLRHTSSNEAAGRLYRDLLRTAKELAAVEQAEPPSYLKSHILNSIGADRPRPVRSAGWLSSWVEWFRNKPKVRYAVVFASGLCVGLLFLVLANPWDHRGEPDASAVSGSLAFFSDLHRLPALASERFAGDGVEGVFRTYLSRGNVLVEIEVHSSETMSLEFNFEPAELRFNGIRRYPEPEGEVHVTQGKISLTGGRSEHDVLSFSGTGISRGLLEARVYKENSLVHQGMLRVQ